MIPRSWLVRYRCAMGSRDRAVKPLFSSLVLAAVSSLLLACPFTMAPQKSGYSGRGAAPLISTSVLLKDARGSVLGYVAETSAAGVTVFTVKGYFVSLGWNGVSMDGTCWYTGIKGSGTPFSIAPDTDRLFGFSVSINGRAYVAATLDASGFAVPDPSITGFQSYYSGAGVVTSAAGIVPPGHAAYALKLVRPEDIGLPSSIAPIHQLVFK
jgi:hypothetical protein